MEIQQLVLGAKLGRHDDFGALVRLYQHRLLASVQAVVKDRSVAEDVVQEAFVRAWSGLDGLRSADAFPAWLWSIGRNLARSHCRSRASDHGGCDEGLEDYPDPRSFEWTPTQEWERLSALLKPGQRTLVELRYGVGLSLRQIGAVLGIPEKTVKSRLFSLRRQLEKALGQPMPEAPAFLEERIMDKIETLRLGAHVFERLSLAAQADFALTVVEQRAFAEGLLADVGQVDRGAEFLALYGTSLAFPELIGILNHVDRFTECRLIERLEVVAPDQAEQIKRNFFVFEDILLFDPAALRLLYQTADRDLLILSLGGTELRVRSHFLDALSEPDRSGLALAVSQADGDRRLVKSAQELVVNGIKDLEQSGRLVLRRKGDVPDGELLITVPV